MTPSEHRPGLVVQAVVVGLAVVVAVVVVVTAVVRASTAGAKTPTPRTIVRRDNVDLRPMSPVGGDSCPPIASGGPERIVGG